MNCKIIKIKITKLCYFLTAYAENGKVDTEKIDTIIYVAFLKVYILMPIK